MKKNKYTNCFKISTIKQALNIINVCKNYKILPIFYLNYEIINGFGSNWFEEFRISLLKSSKINFKLYADCKKNYGLFISLIEKKIDFLKIRGDLETLRRLENIAIKNKVTMNPKFNILDLSKIKNIELKIKKTLK